MLKFRNRYSNLQGIMKENIMKSFRDEIYQLFMSIGAIYI